MHRLYWQVYLSFVAILLLFGVLMSFAFFWVSSRDRRAVSALTTLAEAALPAASASDTEVQGALEQLQETLHLSLAVWGDGERIAATGVPLPAPDQSWTVSRVIPSRGRGFTVALRLSDGRWVVARHHRQVRAPGGVLAVLLLLGIAVALGAYPLVRRLTRRVERLQRHVEALGAGELGARVDVEGNDEVAGLARSVNRAADRIERLVEAQRTLLTGVSHELRSPLARIRVATELLGEGEVTRPELLERVSADISVLDELIGELLLAARQDTLDAVERPAEVELLALAAEIAAEFDAEVSGEITIVRGDARLLRRLIRNLLSNAHRYGGGKPVEVEVRPGTPGNVVFTVSDRGPGIPEAEREQIFEPFYRAKDAPKSSVDGVGLGLAIVRRIAQHHGGKARALPRPGGGTCFEVTLPA